MKVSVVYATTTGNTGRLAEAAAEGARSAGREVSLSTADAADAAETLSAGLIMLGSPAMGAEQLEDSMEAFFSGIEGSLGGRKVALFGSYDWGDGQWLDDWAARVEAAGATLAGTVRAHLDPDDAALDEIRRLASEL